MKKFEVITDIYFGDNALERLSQLEDKKAFIISDPFVVESGLIRHITRPLDRGNIDYVLYTDVCADPTTEKVIAGISAATKEKPDYIIAVGGGSAMDLAKAIRKIAQQMDKNFNPRLIAIPTTSGTGSEVTSFSVITDTESHSKIPLASPDMTPDEAILDEVLVKEDFRIYEIIVAKYTSVNTVVEDDIYYEKTERELLEALSAFVYENQKKFR